LDEGILNEIKESLPLIDSSTHALTFTGGETLSDWKDFIGVLKQCRDLLPATALQVLTNGRAFANSQIVDAWKDINHPKLMAAIPVYVAVDHLHDYVVQAKGAFDETVLGILKLKDRGQLALSATKVIPTSTDDLDAWERRIEQGVAGDQSIPETDRLAIIWARKGQGLFKERVRKIESRCRITAVENPVHLVASHCKPWRDATNEERLDGENGLLLTPSIDHLFDRGFIGFEDNGRLIISPVAHQPSLQRMGIDTTEDINVGAFASGQKQFLDFHRNDVLLKSIRS
jgi:HNH endonuclease